MFCIYKIIDVFCNCLGNEVDAILEYHDKTWLAIEIKLSKLGIESATKTLLKFKKIIAEEKLSKMKSMNIIIATGSAYKTEDGINIIPFDKINFFC
jgi:predicted AAA+ superfamily ATPase